MKSLVSIGGFGDPQHHRWRGRSKRRGAGDSQIGQGMITQGLGFVILSFSGLGIMYEYFW